MGGGRKHTDIIERINLVLLDKFYTLNYRMTAYIHIVKTLSFPFDLYTYLCWCICSWCYHFYAYLIVKIISDLFFFKKHLLGV